MRSKLFVTLGAFAVLGGSFAVAEHDQKNNQLGGVYNPQTQSVVPGSGTAAPPIVRVPAAPVKPAPNKVQEAVEKDWARIAARHRERATEIAENPAAFRQYLERMEKRRKELSDQRHEYVIPNSGGQITKEGAEIERRFEQVEGALHRVRRHPGSPLLPQRPTGQEIESLIDLIQREGLYID